MKMTQEEISEALNQFYGDTSRSQRETLEGLHQIQSELELLIETLEEEVEGDG